MASLTLTVTDVVHADGRVYINWSDGVQQEFGSLADAQAARDNLFSNRDTLRAIALARYLRIDPDGSNPGLMEGRDITFDDTTNSIVNIV